MTQHWIHHNSNKHLILFFNGWGMTYHIVEHLDPTDYDVLAFDSYHSAQTFDFSQLSDYLHIHVVAWSMGVWYVPSFCRFDFLPIAKTIALSGTTEPISDSLGIPQAIFHSTAENISAENLEKFARRTMGSKAAFEKLLNLPTRSLESIKSEIDWWTEHYTVPQNDFWQVAVVALKDAIIPPANQLNYWRCAPARVLELNIPHYPFSAFTSWDEILNL